ncbi:hypothetical protein [Phocaeicola sp.]
MKRRNFLNKLFGSLLVASTFLSSCSNNDLNGNIASGNRILKFNVSQTFDNNSNEGARSIIEKPDTVYQNFSDGTQIKAVIEQDGVINSRANTTYPVLTGTKVAAIVIDESTNKIHRIQPLTVESNGSMSCEVPNDATVSIIFYSYNSIIDIPMVDQDNTIYKEVHGKDVMWFKTQPIQPTDTNLGNVKFKHLFSRAKVVMHDKRGIGISKFETTLEKSGSTFAMVDLIAGTIESQDHDKDISLNKDATSPAIDLESDYEIIIPNDAISTMKLSVTNIDGRTLTDKYIILNKKLEQGYSYTINIYVDAFSNQIEDEPSIFYQWDAKAPWTIEGALPAYGKEEYFNTDKIASNSCKDCPTAEEIKKILAAGVYWDEHGPEWVDKIGRTRTRGLWIPKRSIWEKEAGAKTYAVANQILDEQRASGDYIFLPCAGFMSFETCEYGPLSEPAAEAWYWSSEPSTSGGVYSSEHANCLYFTRVSQGNDDRAYADVKLKEAVPRKMGGSIWRAE